MSFAGELTAWAGCFALEAEDIAQVCKVQPAVADAWMRGEVKPSDTEIIKIWNELSVTERNIRLAIESLWSKKKGEPRETTAYVYDDLQSYLAASPLAGAVPFGAHRGVVWQASCKASAAGRPFEIKIDGED